VAGLGIAGLGVAAAFKPFGLETFKGLEREVAPNEHPFKLYIDPILVPDMQFAKENLPKYIADMNYILGKNTNRHFNFNPETDIVLTEEPPSSNMCPDCSGVGYEVWADVQPTAPGYLYSYGGRQGCTMSCTGVLAGLHWTRIYNPDELTAGSQQLHDYWIQVDHMLHEFAHDCGAGMGEYYNLATVNDSTGIEPLLNIDLYDPNDAFWSDKKDFFPDLMLRLAYDNPLIGNPKSRPDLLDKTKFGDLTAAIINGNYFKNFPILDYSNLQIEIVNKRTNMPIPDVNIKLWNIRGTSGNPAILLQDSVSDETGKFLFDWESPGSAHGNYNFLRLVKVYKDGYESSAKYISIFDADIQLFLQGRDMFSAKIAMEPELNQFFLPFISKSGFSSDY